MEAAIIAVFIKSAYPYAIFKDNSKWNYKRKKGSVYGRENLTIVTPSAWLKGLVEQSFLKEYPVEVIPNGINLDNFIPLTEEQETKRRQQMAGYPHRTILGVANRWEERKGLDTFIRLAEELPANYTVEILGLDKAQTVQLKKKVSDR